MSESHLRQMLLVGESAGKHIADYTSRFQAEFIALLSRRYVDCFLPNNCGTDADLTLSL